MNKSIIVMLAALGLAACEQEGPAERAGESLDEAVENVGESADEVRDEVEEVREEAEELANETSEPFEDEPQ